MVKAREVEETHSRRHRSSFCQIAHRHRQVLARAVDPIPGVSDHLARIERSKKGVGVHYHSPMWIAADEEKKGRRKNRQRYRADKRTSLAQTEPGMINELVVTHDDRCKRKSRYRGTYYPRRRSTP
jgi:hypothetical protein